MGPRLQGNSGGEFNSISGGERGTLGSTIQTLFLPPNTRPSTLLPPFKYFSSMPLISVIIPTFNRSDLLRRAIDSVLSQSFKDFELIVVNDGSTDNTEKTLAEYNDITLLNLKHNSGVSCARNRGVKHSGGEWVSFLDSDDQWLPNKLQEQVEWMFHTPQCTIFQSREIWIRDGKRVNQPRALRKKEGDLFFESLQRCSITPSTVMIRRSLFEEHGGFDEALPACEDYDLWLRITASERVGLVDREHLIRYGGHPDQLSLSTPCLDKYRVYALQKLLSKEGLNGTQKTATIDTLRKKAAIIANGALKRGNLNDYQQYIKLTV